MSRWSAFAPWMARSATLCSAPGFMLLRCATSMSAACGRCLKKRFGVAGDGTAGFHVSLDMDAVDPQEAPGVGTPVQGGITYREAHLAMEMLGDTGRITSMEVVEVNPVIDEANRTAILAVELVMSAMGKRIL